MRRGCSQSRWWSLPCAVLVASCGKLIGLEPLRDLPDAGSPMQQGSQYETGNKDAGLVESGSAAGSSAGGQAGSSGHESSAAAAGSTAATAATAGAAGHHQNIGQSGDGSSAGKGAAGDTSTEAGRAGSASGMAGTVHGTLIDTRKRPVPNARVQVGARNATSDANGAFTLDDVPDTYDLGVVVDFNNIRNEPAHHAWFIQGLHRRDPTIEVYAVPSDTHYAQDLLVHAQGTPSPLPSNQLVYAAYGVPHADEQMITSELDLEFSGVSWSGPTSVSGTLHALLVHTTEQYGGAPLEYLGYDARPLALQEGGTTDLNVDLSKAPAIGMLKGNVTHHGGRRANWVVIRWADGTSLSLDSADATTDTFSLLVPLIPDASLSVVALEGLITDTSPYAVAFVDDAAPGQDLALAIPSPPTQVAPAEGAMLAPDTEFEWRSTAAVAVIRIDNKDLYDELFIVGAGQRVRMPTPSELSYTLPRNTAFTWRVERHGEAASLDDAMGANGHLSAFWYNGLHGEKRGAGSFAASSKWACPTPP